MRTTFVLRGGRVVDPASGTDGIRDVLVRDGRIAGVDTLPDVADDVDVVDVAGLVVAPGFVDVHCHLRQPGQDHKETLQTGLAAAAAGGFTTVCCMPNTSPPIDSVEHLQRLAADAARVSPLHLRIIAAISRSQEGRHLAPLRDLAQAGAVAFSDDGKPVWNEALMRAALRMSGDLDLPLSLHEEDPALAAGGVMNAGAVAMRLGLAGLDAAAEEEMIARDLRLLEEEGGRIHIAHVSTRGAVELVRAAKARGLNVSAEATPHHLSLTDDLVARGWNGQRYDTRAKVNPPLRSRADVDAVVAGLTDGTIEAIATDHAPHALHDKSGSFEEAAFGISLFETALASVLPLVHDGRLPLVTLVERLTNGPCRLFNLAAGTLKVGAPADIVVFDPDHEWTVDARAFLSRGKNTPLDGQRMRGRVVLTLAAGDVVHAREDLLNGDAARV